MKDLIWAPPAAHATVWKNPPEILLCSLQPRQIEKWRALNRWADAINMIIFTDDEPAEAVKSIMACRPFAEQTGHAPHIVINAPPESWADLDLIRLTSFSSTSTTLVIDKPVDAALRYKDAVAAVAKALRGMACRCAWIQPESDHSIGAVTLAKHKGLCVAYSQRPMIDSIGAIAAGKMGVNVQTLGRMKASGAH